MNIIIYKSFGLWLTTKINKNDRHSKDQHKLHHIYENSIYDNTNIIYNNFH